MPRRSAWLKNACSGDTCAGREIMRTCPFKPRLMTTHRPTPDKDTIALLPPFEWAWPGPDYAGEYRRSGTRNFHNRLGKNTNVYLASAELAAITSKMGKFPTVARYHEAMGVVNADGAAIYQYLNFNQIEEYVENAKGVAA